MQNVEIMIKINSYIFIAEKIKMMDNKLLSTRIMLKVLKERKMLSWIS